MDNAVVVAVDQGSSSTKALALDATGTVVARAVVPVTTTHPHPGHVEHDPLELEASVRTALARVTHRLGGRTVAAVGLSTQRESLVLWERATRRPVAPVLSWQDSRSHEVVARVRARGLAGRVREISGLPLDTMFSAAGLAWLLDRHDPDRTRSRRGDLCAGTVDAWLAGTPDEHVTEVGNASRTQLLDVATGTWSPELLDAFDVPAALLPRPVPSASRFPARWDCLPGAPLTAVLADSHASVFAHGLRGPGAVKATYGTGSSLMTLLDRPADDGPGQADAADPLAAVGLCRTVAWQLGDGAPLVHAAEGNIRSSGSTLMWVAGLLGVDVAEVARQAAGAGAEGVHLVPAFNGLGAPWWDLDARGAVTGLTLGASRAQLCRAALESVAFQVCDVLDALAAAGHRATALVVDGGASANDHLMALQADLAGLPVLRRRDDDVCALGAAHLAGSVAQVWADAPVTGTTGVDRFDPGTSPQHRAELRAGWAAAVGGTRAATPPAPLTA